MAVRLDSGAGTGDKIRKNYKQFLVKYDEKINDSYFFSWKFNKQSGYITVVIKDGMIDESSQIGTDHNSYPRFQRPLGLYNDPTLRWLFEYLSKRVGDSYKEWFHCF